MYKIIELRKKTIKEMFEEQGYKVLGVVHRGGQAPLVLVEYDPTVITHMDKQKMGEFELVDRDDDDALSYFHGKIRDKLKKVK